MRLKTDIKMLKITGLLFGLGYFLTQSTFANQNLCMPTSTQMRCSTQLDDFRLKLSEQYFTAYLITDAPLRLLQDTQKLWSYRLDQCQKISCFQQQFESRLDELNVFISLNQSLTQHYLKYENGTIARPAVHLKVHQLGKDKIKIEGIAYRSPKNRSETQTIPFLAYTTPDEKADITNNENDCKYRFNYQKATLSVSSLQKGCERFNGIYRLYD